MWLIVIWSFLTLAEVIGIVYTYLKIEKYKQPDASEFIYSPSLKEALEEFNKGLIRNIWINRFDRLVLIMFVTYVLWVPILTLNDMGIIL